MSYDVLVQSPVEGEYRATVLGWPNLFATGKSERSALEKVKKELRQQLSQGKIVHFSVEELAENNQPAEHPWQEFLGMWKDDETFDDFIDQMNRFRQAQEQE